MDGTVRWFKSDDWYEINTHAPLLNATKMVIVVTVLLWNSIYWYVPFHMFQYTKNRLIFSMFNVSIFSLVYWLTSHVLYSRTFFFYLFVDMCGVFAGAWHFFSSHDFQVRMMKSEFFKANRLNKTLKLACRKKSHQILSISDLCIERISISVVPSNSQYYSANENGKKWPMISNCSFA